MGFFSSFFGDDEDFEISEEEKERIAHRGLVPDCDHRKYCDRCRIEYDDLSKLYMTLRVEESSKDAAIASLRKQVKHLKGPF